MRVSDSVEVLNRVLEGRVIECIQARGFGKFLDIYTDYGVVVLRACSSGKWRTVFEGLLEGARYPTGFVGASELCSHRRGQNFSCYDTEITDTTFISMQLQGGRVSFVLKSEHVNNGYGVSPHDSWWEILDRPDLAWAKEIEAAVLAEAVPEERTDAL